MIKYIIPAMLFLSSCLPAEVRRWNAQHVIPCNDSNCGKLAEFR